jgi:outer membrane protein, multidrug efflux system
MLASFQSKFWSVAFGCGALLTAGITAAQPVGPLVRDALAPLTTDTSTVVPATVLHRFTLAECLARAEQHHPNLAAAQSRLEGAQAQRREATTAPFFDVRLTGSGGLLPRVRVRKTDPLTNKETEEETFSGDLSQLSLSSLSSLAPIMRFGLDIRIPIYTFGKIQGYRDAADANIRLNEWEREKTRLQVRSEVRRAYFGLQSARDGLYVLDQALDVLDKAISGLAARIAKHEAGIDEYETTRLAFLRDDLGVRRAEVRRLEQQALTSLRFLTGVQEAFDVPETPLERPLAPLGPLVQYLAAARTHRPDVNIARAGLEARRAQLSIARARLLPDFALGVGGSYQFAPVAAKQLLGQLQDNAYIGLGFSWQLDFLPALARVDQANAQVQEVRNLQRFALGGSAVEVDNQYGVVLEARNREETWARAEHRAKGWLIAMRDAVELGTRDDRAVVEPLRYHLNARAEHIRALFDLHVALSELARVTGWEDVAPR